MPTSSSFSLIAASMSALDLSVNSSSGSARLSRTLSELNSAPLDFPGAVVGRETAQEQSKEGAFAAAGLAEDPEPFLRRHIEADAAEHFLFAEREMHIVEFSDGLQVRIFFLFCAPAGSDR